MLPRWRTRLPRERADAQGLLYRRHDARLCVRLLLLDGQGRAGRRISSRGEWWPVEHRPKQHRIVDSVFVQLIR